MIKISDIKKTWKDMNLSCRNSYKPEYIKEFYTKLGLEFPEKLIYTKERLREMAANVPRVDAEDVLVDVCKKIGIKPDPKQMETANKMFGEGSRRQCVEEAYLGREE